MPSRRHTITHLPELPPASAWTRLQHASSARLYVATPASCLHTSAWLHQQRDSGAPCLQVYAPAARLRSSVPPRLRTRSATPALPTSIPPRLHACSASQALPISIPSRLRAFSPTPLPAFHTSILPSLHACSAPLAPHTSKPPYFHVCTPAAHRRRPYLYFFVSTSTRRQGDCKLRSFMPLHHTHLFRTSIASELKSSIPLCRYTCIDPPDIRTSVSLHLHRSSRPANLHVATPSSSF